VSQAAFEILTQPLDRPFPNFNGVEKSEIRLRSLTPVPFDPPAFRNGATYVKKNRGVPIPVLTKFGVGVV